VNVWREVEEHADYRAELAPILLHNIHKAKTTKPAKRGFFFGRGDASEPDAMAAAMAELDEAEAAEREAGIAPISTDPEFLKAMATAKAAGWGMVLPDEMRGQHASR
jgi:hypothetical protein